MEKNNKKVSSTKKIVRKIDNTKKDLSRCVCDWTAFCPVHAKRVDGSVYDFDPNSYEAQG